MTETVVMHSWLYVVTTLRLYCWLFQWQRQLWCWGVIAGCFNDRDSCGVEVLLLVVSMTKTVEMHSWLYVVTTLRLYCWLFQWQRQLWCWGVIAGCFNDRDSCGAQLTVRSDDVEVLYCWLFQWQRQLWRWCVIAGCFNDRDSWGVEALFLVVSMTETVVTLRCYCWLFQWQRQL